MRSLAHTVTLALLRVGLVHSLSAQTPQMGWNSWNTFKTNFDQSTLQTTADLLASTGLKDAGYTYLIMDEGWQDLERDSSGRQQPNLTKLPDGVPGIAKYVHGKGLKLGIYSDAGIYDCGFYPGSYGNEELDAATYASWGVDYLKDDNCGGFYANTESPYTRFAVMRDALKTSGREIFCSLCQWGHQFPWYWADLVGQSYRMSGDITSIYSDTGKDCPVTGCSVLTIIRKMRELSRFQKKGAWADMDMLEIGNGNMTLRQQQTHFSFWAALKSPLIIGADVSKLAADSLSVLKNEEMIAVNQDSEGEAMHYLPELSVEKQSQVWAGALSRGRTVVLVLNEGNVTSAIEVELAKIPGLNAWKLYQVRDVWGVKSVRNIKGVVNVTVEVDETKVLVFS
ncbi:glycoside hydrolase family 27 protein [Lophium mytilinum]|uniref:Alpha-galactosidase n=1 Tax=Lophium mytilinum TaxID=390894 RepID=A0A6A6QYX0_9PEZI|nr:glycoside hydrolase family 27 protein [Lophium mytilinum]